jgi:hypothetical protein
MKITYLGSKIKNLKGSLEITNKLWNASSLKQSLLYHFEYKLEHLLNWGDKTSMSEKEDMLHMAQSTTWRGLNDNLRGMKGKKTTDNCDHDIRESFERCKTCGKWIK